MPWQWVSRIFNRNHSNGYEQKRSNNFSSPRSSGKNYSSNKGDCLIEDASKRLDIAFFCWLLGCSESDLAPYSIELQEKENIILKSLDQTSLGIDSIPRRPASFPLLLNLLKNNKSSNAELANTLLSDPALATHTLKTVNSPFFRTTHETIDSVDRAVFILGNHGIRNVISATVMMPMMKSSHSQEGIFSQKVWEWGLLSATASDQYSELQKDNVDSIYLLGLLPALTYLVIFQSLRAINQGTSESMCDLEPSIIKSIIEKRSWKMCHDICQQWGLPPSSVKHLLDAERPSPSTTSSPLRDGLLMGRHKVLQTNADSPINDHKAFLLTSASESIDKNVIQYLDSRVNGAPIP